jgi:putative SOS response-associated peptidase YedK
MPERFALHDSPELLTEIFALQDIPTILGRYNIAPNQTVAAVRKYGDGLNRLDFLRWGLIPSWAKTKSVGNDMITACSEYSGPRFQDSSLR